MIQSYIKKVLSDALPSLEWSVDFKTEKDNTGSVYLEGGSQPGQYEIPYRYPRYMVYISSSDWEFAEFAAMKALELIHKLANKTVKVDYSRDGEVIETKYFYVQMIRASGDVNPLGIENNIMDYSVNFDANLIETKEENYNAISN